MHVAGSTPSSRVLILFWSAFLASGCSLRGLSFLNDPEFRSWMNGLRVVIESPSRSALYTDGTLVSETALVGEWAEIGWEAAWLFEETDEPGYRLTITDDREALTVLDAKVVRLGDHRFVDIQYFFPGLPASDESWPESNGVFKLVVRSDRIQLAGLSQTWLKEMSESGDLEIGHEIEESGLITLDASTAELRAFISQVADNPEAFPGPTGGGSGFDLLRPARRGAEAIGRVPVRGPPELRSAHRRPSPARR